MQQLFWHAQHADFAGSIFTGADDVFFDIFLRLFDDFFYATRVNPSVLQEQLQCLARYFAANRVEAA